MGLRDMRTRSGGVRKIEVKLHRTSTDSQGARVRKKLLAKTNWFKKRRKKEDQDLNTRRSGCGVKGAPRRGSTELEQKTVLFVEQSPGGELAKRIRESLRRMENTLGFKVKVVERTGRSLGSKFPINNLWAGLKCGREDCVTCEQGGRRSYHNVRRQTWCMRISAWVVTQELLRRGSRRISGHISLQCILEKQAAPFMKGARSTGRG